MDQRKHVVPSADCLDSQRGCDDGTYEDPYGAECGTAEPKLTSTAHLMLICWVVCESSLGSSAFGALYYFGAIASSRRDGQLAGPLPVLGMITAPTNSCQMPALQVFTLQSIRNEARVSQHKLSARRFIVVRC